MATRSAEPAVAEDDVRLYPAPGPAGGCASGECLPDAGASATPASASPAPVATPPAPRAPAPTTLASAPPAPRTAAPTPAAPRTAPAAPVEAPDEPDDRTDPLARPFVRSGRDNGAHSLVERWRAVIETVRQASPRFAVSLMNARVAALRAGEAVIGFGPDQGFHRVQVSSPAGRATVEKALSEHFGRPTKLVLDDAAAQAAGTGPTLAEQERQGRAARERTVEEKVRAHPSVMTALRVLGGELEHVALLEPEPPAGAAARGDAPEEDAS